MERETNLPVVAALAFGGAALTYLATIGLDAYALSVLEFMGINIILAVSLNLTNGLTGLFSLGHPGFMAVGGYTAALLTIPAARKAALLPSLPDWLVTQSWAFLPALLAGGVCAAGTALVIGFPVLRLRGHYLAVATLGFIIIVETVVINTPGYTRGALGLSGLAPLTETWGVYGWVVVTLYVCWKLKHSSRGRSMLALRENEMAAQCLGVNVTTTRLLAFCLGAFFAGVAGGLWGHLVTIVTPHSFSILMAFNLVVMVVLGGSGSISGAVLAAIGLTIATEAMRPLEEGLELYGLSQILIAIGVFMTLLYRPKGLFGSGEHSVLTRAAGPVHGPIGGPISRKT